jgi:2-C-methyl-D-erythritol 2,4-cyclodiphosphate synthase
VRVGIGYDVHRLISGHALLLGGVPIDSEWGLEGHSDADVLLHAIADALLGALALGDLGQHFPDTDPRYRGIASASLLEAVLHMVRARGYDVHNLDSVIIAQRPRLAAYIPAMRRNVAALLQTDHEAVSVKAKSAEHIGALGRGEGIAVYAVCTVVQHEP